MQWLTPIIPAPWEAEEGKWLHPRSLRPASATWQNPVSTKNINISWAWWHVPVVPATWEAEAGELLEPRRQRLQWAKIAPLYSRLVDRVRFCFKKKKKIYIYIYIYIMGQKVSRPRCIWVNMNSSMLRSACNPRGKQDLTLRSHLGNAWSQLGDTKSQTKTRNLGANATGPK